MLLSVEIAKISINGRKGLAKVGWVEITWSQEKQYLTAHPLVIRGVEIGAACLCKIESMEL